MRLFGPKLISRCCPVQKEIRTAWQQTPNHSANRPKKVGNENSQDPWKITIEWYIFQKVYTVNSRFKKDLKLQIHLHKAFFSDDQFLDSLHKSFLNQTTLDLRKEKWTFLNQEFTVSKFKKIGYFSKIADMVQ